MATDIAVVKKLEWSERKMLPAFVVHGTIDDMGRHWYQVVDTSHNGGSFRVDRYGVEIGTFGTFGTLEAAKAAAQADHEQRILSVLSQDYLDLKASHDAAVAALRDMLAGWRYIRTRYGDLPGVGWDRAEQAATAALAALTTPAAPADADDGWIAWEGGECPVARHTEVDVKFRDGTVEEHSLAGEWEWYHLLDSDGDIVAYRVRPAAGGAL